MLKVTAIGRFGRDPEVTYSQSGIAIAKFSIGCDIYDPNAKGNKGVEWLYCVAFKKKAEVIGEYCHKGDKLYIEGVLKTNKYEKDGVTKYSTSIIVNQIEFLTSKKEHGKQSAAANDNYNDGGYYQQPTDDIPF